MKKNLTKLMLLLMAGPLALAWSCSSSDEAAPAEDAGPTQEERFSRCFGEDFKMDSVLEYKDLGGTQTVAILEKGLELATIILDDNEGVVAYDWAEISDGNGQGQAKWLSVKMGEQQIELSVEWPDPLNIDNYFTLVFCLEGSQIELNGHWYNMWSGYPYADFYQLTPCEYAFGPEGGVVEAAADQDAYDRVPFMLENIVISNDGGKTWKTYTYYHQLPYSEDGPGWEMEFQGQTNYAVTEEWLTITVDHAKVRIEVAPNDGELPRSFHFLLSDGTSMCTAPGYGVQEASE